MSVHLKAESRKVLILIFLSLYLLRGGRERENIYNNCQQHSSSSLVSFSIVFVAARVPPCCEQSAGIVRPRYFLIVWTDYSELRQPGQEC